MRIHHDKHAKPVTRFKAQLISIKRATRTGQCVKVKKFLEAFGDICVQKMVEKRGSFIETRTGMRRILIVQ